MTTITQTVPRESGAASWVDGKRWLWLLSPVLPLLTAGSILAVIYGAPSWLLAQTALFFKPS